jgi:hypothetical protein
VAVQLSALQQDPGLSEFDVNEKVIPATPMILMALRRAIAFGWRQEALVKNTQEVADLGKRLYERVAKLGDPQDEPPASREELCRAGLGAAKKLLDRLETGDVFV